ncbi:MAG: hypothetical protein ACOYIF_02750 [Acetivibrionales bacterium]|jgi:type II secretory pathway component GspD/PulD (secretin)
MFKNNIFKSSFLLLLIAAVFISCFSVLPSIAIVEKEAAEKDDIISINMKEADIRDALSAIAVHMNKSIIYTGEPMQVTYHIEDVDARTALSYLLNSMSMDYIEDNNVLIVGKRETLTKEFYNKLSLTKFVLKHINSDEIKESLEELGIPVQAIIINTNKKVIWIKGLPEDLGTVNELISMIDREENVFGETGIYSENLTPINMTYITPEEMNKVMGRLGLREGIILNSNPMTLWIYGSKAEIAEILKVQKTIDIPENALSDNIIISDVKMTYLTVDEIIPILIELVSDVNIITFGRSQKTLWLNGSKESVKLAAEIIKKFDIEKHKNDDPFFIYETVYITANELKRRFDNLNLKNITMETINYPEFSKSVMIFCPEDFRLFAMNHINKLDVMTEKIKVPVDFSDEAGGNNKLKKRRDLLVDLTGISSDSFTISENVARDNSFHYIMYIEETQENIKIVKDYITYIDNPLSDGLGI